MWLWFPTASGAWDSQMLRRMAFPRCLWFPRLNPAERAGPQLLLQEGPSAGWLLAGRAVTGDLLISSSRDRDMRRGEATQGGGGETLQG